MQEDIESRFLTELNPNVRIVRNVCRAYFADEVDRQDAYQETVFQAWKSFPSFRGDSKFSTWLYRIALNVALSFVRKQRRVVPLAEVDDSPAGEDEMITALYRAIYSLSPIERALTLLYLDGLSYEEIAGVTGLSAKNVGVRLVRIRKKLAEKIEKER